MFIKTLTLRGFLSYRDLTTVSFTPHLNIIVGANGTGKSTLLLAIRFAMGHEIPSDRLLWLYHTSESRVLAGYVILTLDNQDGRVYTLEKGDVVIRREFNSQKDEISLNGKQISRHELLSLLEAAGFSRYNPYSFIHQHEVFELVRMNPNQRLAALKECAGTRVYDVRRSEALRSLNETKIKKATIDSMLETINEKVAEFRREQTELEECLKYETEKLCLTSVIARKQLEQETARLEEIQKEYEGYEKRKSQFTRDLQDITERIKELDTLRKDEITSYQSKNELLEKSLNRFKQVQRNLTRSLLDLSGLKTKEKQLRSEIERCQETLNKHSELNQLEETAIQHLETVEEEKTREILEYSFKIFELEKKLIKTSFLDSTIEEPADVLKNQLILRKQDITSLNTMIDETESKIKEVTHCEVEALKNLGDLECSGLKSVVSDSETTAFINVDSNDLASTEKEGLLQEKELIEKRTALQQKLSQAESAISYITFLENFLKTMRPSQLSGYSECFRFAKEQHWIESNQFLGTLLDQIRVEAVYRKAVESVGGSQLLNILVKDQHDASRLALHLRETGAGYAVITPLEQLTRGTHVAQEELDKTFNNKNIVPLVSVIHVKQMIRPALYQIFSKYVLLLNQDFDLAQFIASKGFDCVTLEGDKFSRKGTLTGGYVAKPSRISLKTILNETNQQYETIRTELEVLNIALKERRKKQVETLMHTEDETQANCTFNQNREETSTSAIGLQRELNNYREQKNALVSCRMELISQRECFERCVSQLEQRISCYKKQGTNTFQKLNEDKNLQRSIKRDLQELTTQKRLVEDKRKQICEQLHQKRQNLEVYIQLIRSQEDQKIKTLNIELQECLVQIKSLGIQCDILEQDKYHLDSSVQLLKASQHDSLEKQKIFDDEIHQCQTTLEKIQRDLSQVSSDALRLEDQISSLKVKIGTLNIRQKTTSGSSELVSSLLSLSDKELSERFALVIKKLGEFTYVNKSASNQCASIIRQQEDLLQQRETLYRGEDIILQLINDLDEKKDSTLLKTFENVNAQFHRIFAQLVPGGKGKLVLKKVDTSNVKRPSLNAAVESNSSDATLSSEEALILSDDLISGVDIKVRFASSYGYTRLESLSGGQKSTVALALIFALQKIEAAPFYVFDEVDSHLDAQYRGGVAQLIQAQAKKNQIIVISHKEPMIRAGQWFLKTQLAANSTHVAPTTLQDALIASRELMLPSASSHEASQFSNATEMIS